MADNNIIYDDEDGKIIAGDETSGNDPAGTVSEEPVPQESVTIISSIVQYYGTNDTDDIPDGSTIWLTNAPTGFEYVWIRTQNIYSNGAIEYSDPVLDESLVGEVEDEDPADDEPTNEFEADEELDLSDLPDGTETYSDGDEGEEVVEEPEELASNEAEDLLNQLGIFNLLTNNGASKGIFMQPDEDGNQQLYINMTFARSGVLQIGGSENLLGVLQILDKNNSVIGQWDKDGITIKDGVIQDSTGKTYINLKTGELQLNGYLMSASVEYALGESSTQAPETGWSTSMPVREDGKYIWQRTTLKKSGSDDEVSTVCIQGSDGNRGTGIYKITTAPSSYQTQTGGFTPSYRIALAAATSQSGASEIIVGDVLEYSYYHYPVGYVDGSYVYLGARTSIRGAAGAAGEDAVLLRIDSSRGVVFKNDLFDTTLSVTVICGAKTITDITALREEFGAGASLAWYWRRYDDDDWRVMSSSDSHISADGFMMTVTPDDVDEQIVFQCDLII